jgi:succinate dehydrogenase / fumarate reductase membrane anchor subunit
MRNVGGAHGGLTIWLLQRTSAVLMALLLPLFLLRLVLSGPLDFNAWHALFLPLTAKIAVLLFVAAMLLHAWIGLREVLIDYVHPLALRLALYLVFAALYLGSLLWAADILWSVR